jgi:hypothetical protein
MIEERILDTDIPTVELSNKVYKRNQIAVATFLGGPLVTTYLMVSNYKAFGEVEKVRNTWVLGIIATIVIQTIAFLIPESSNIPAITFAVIYVIIANALVQAWQEAKINALIHSGGQAFGWWRVILISIIGLILTLAVMLSYLYFSGNIDLEGL